MSHFSSCVLVIHIVACLLTGALGRHYPDIIYMSDSCGSNYLVGSDVRIQLSDSEYLTSNTTCSITLAPTSGAKLVVKFLNYFMNPDYINIYGDCQYESIQLYNSNGAAQLSGTRGYCDFQTPTLQYDLGPGGRFSYTTYNKRQILKANVDLLVTNVVGKESTENFACPSGYFDCYYNNYCVRDDVTCNGYDDCGNERDEIEGCSLKPAVIVGIVVGLVVCISVFAALMCLAIRLRRRAYYAQLH